MKRNANVLISAFVRLSGLLACLLLVSCTALLAPNVKTELHDLRAGNYQIDKKHARILFKVNHLGLSTYVGRFNDFDATLDFDPENPSASLLEATIKTGSLDLNDETLEGTLSKSNWFDSAQFPEAVFTSLSVDAVDAVNAVESLDSSLNSSRLNFSGNLTLLGITRPIDMLVDFHGGATNLLTGKYTIGFTATGKLKRSEFGMDKYLGLVGDDVSIEVYAEFLKL